MEITPFEGAVISLGETQLKLTAIYQGISFPDWGDGNGHGMYEVRVTEGDSSTCFDFYQSQRDTVNETTELTADALISAFYCALSDAISYDSAEGVADFRTEFGYKDIDEAAEVYNKCRDIYEQLSQFGDVWVLYEAFREEYEDYM